MPDLQEQEKELNHVKYQIAIRENEYAPNCILGIIFLCIYDAPPNGCAYCDGTLLRINEYSALCTILMIKYGGSGKNFCITQFNRSRKKLNGVKYVICLDGIYPPIY